MHPEVKKDLPAGRHGKPGRCPKCGMDLVRMDDLKNLPNKENTDIQNSYRPLAIIIGLIFLVTAAIALKDLQIGTFTIKSFISNFMAGFFIVFSGFKLMDLKGFAQGYSTYDLLAKRWFTYGYIYPFIELFFGLSMIIGFQERAILMAEIIVMTFSGIGVLIKILKKEKFQCACLGTFLKVPLTKVTLVEDFGMASLAGIMLLIK